MSRKLLVVAAAGLLVACGGSQQRPSALDRLDRESSGPVAREVQRSAPDAYAEYARAVRAAEAAAGGPRDVLQDRVTDAEMTLAWAATEARAADARARVENADRRRIEAERDALRMESQADVLNHEAQAARAASQELAQARTASASPSSVPATERATVAATIRQQASLDLAAAALLGASSEDRTPVESAITTAEHASRGDPTTALVSAGRAFVAAESLLRVLRSRAASSGGTDASDLVHQLSEAGGMEPRRDARGVIAVMRGLFAGGNTLAATANGRLQTMARVIQSHPDAHVRVEAYVGGSDRVRAEHAGLARAQSVVAALVRDGVPATRVEPAGVYRIGAIATHDDAVEIVLVLPTTP